MAVTKRQRFEVFKRDKFTCQYCGNRPPDVVLECDHIVPVAEGGPDDLENLTTACFACNRGKADKPLNDVAPALDEMDVLAGVQEMLERRMALQRSIKVAEAKRELAEEAVDVFSEWWDEEVGDSTEWERRSVRHFVTKLEMEQIREAVEVTGTLVRRSPWKHGRQAWRYFCGVCWTMIRAEPEE